MRGTGKTTRILDRLVQEFFTKGFCYVYEQRDSTKDEKSQLLYKFVHRMNAEHNGTKFAYNYGNYDNIYCYKVEKHDL